MRSVARTSFNFLLFEMNNLWKSVLICGLYKYCMRLTAGCATIRVFNHRLSQISTNYAARCSCRFAPNAEWLPQILWPQAVWDLRRLCFAQWDVAGAMTGIFTTNEHEWTRIISCWWWCTTAPHECMDAHKIRLMNTNYRANEGRVKLVCALLNVADNMQWRGGCQRW